MLEDLVTDFDHTTFADLEARAKEIGAAQIAAMRRDASGQVNAIAILARGEDAQLIADLLAEADRRRDQDLTLISTPQDEL